MQFVPAATDVLHNENHSHLTAEEIAKALAHHNHRHHGDQVQASPAKPTAGKKSK